MLIIRVNQTIEDIGQSHLRLRAKERQYDALLQELGEMYHRHTSHDEPATEAECSVRSLSEMVE